MRKTPMKLFLDLNNWIMQHMMELFVLIAVASITIGSLQFYTYMHPLPAATEWFITFFFLYLEYRIIIN